MREFRSQNTGKLHIANNYWLEFCPVCSKQLYWNSYELEVGNISFDFKVEYCEKCDDYYIHIL